MKSLFLIYSLLLLASLGISGCSGNEDFCGDENGLLGRELSFNTEISLLNKILTDDGDGTSIPVYWDASDLVSVYSPQSTTVRKLTVYKVNKEGDSSTFFSLKTGQTGLTWNSAGNAQSFCSFFPSTAATFSGVEGSILATATLPSAQNGRSAANGFMAGYQYTDAAPLKFHFAPLMNVLRLKIVDSHLNADAAHTVSAIVIKSKQTPSKKVSGTLKVGYPSSSVSNLGAGSFTCDVSSATGDSIVITGSALTSITNSALNVTAYLLPQSYNSLKITVYTNSNKNYVAKSAFYFTTFAKSSVCDLAFGNLDGVTTIPRKDKKDYSEFGSSQFLFAHNLLQIE